MNCPKCQRHMHDILRECPHCGVLVDRYREHSVPGSSATKSSMSFKWLVQLILVLSVLGGMAFHYLKPRRLDLNEMNTPQDSCFQKARCVLIYMAPWCSVCKNTMPLVRQLKQRWQTSQKIGFKAMVGQDSEANLRELAKELGPGTVLDLQGSYARNLGVSGFPTWFVMNEKGKVLQSFAGGFQGEMAPEQLKLLIAQQFKLNGYD